MTQLTSVLCYTLFMTRIAIYARVSTKDGRQDTDTRLPGFWLDSEPVLQ